MLVNLGGGLALFLYGMHKMTEALKIVAGERVKDLLAKLTTNRFSAAFAGTAVTAVIQSSSITTVLVVGFITAGNVPGQISLNQVAWATVKWDVSSFFELAFEVSHRKTHFIDPFNASDAMLYHFASSLKF